jgi:hypothetical protein
MDINRQSDLGQNRFCSDYLFWFRFGIPMGYDDDDDNNISNILNFDNRSSWSE